MRLLGFTMFPEKARSGIKRCTIRFDRTAPTLGEVLCLWEIGQDGNGDHLIGYTAAVMIVSIQFIGSSVLVNDCYLSDDEIRHLAIADGFDNMHDFWVFFRNKTKVGWIAYWGPYNQQVANLS